MRKRSFLFMVLSLLVSVAFADNLTIIKIGNGSGNSQEFEISVNGATSKMSAFQFDVVLPEGAVIQQDENEAFIASLGNTSSDHQLYVAKVGPNTYRFLSYSMTNTELSTSDTPLLYFNVSTEDETTLESVEASVEGMLLVEGDGTETTVEETTFDVGETTPIKIGSKGKATFTGKVSLDFSFSDEVKAYVATGIDKESGTIWLTRVKDVPAGVPVMIKGEANKTYNVPVKETKDSYYKNMFVGNTSGESITINETSDDGTKTNYYMSGGQFVSVKGNAKIGDGKCYLQLPTTLPASVTGANQPVKIAATGKSSYAAPVDLDFTNVDVLKAFTATGYDRSSKTIWLTRVMKAQKGEGLLLKGDANQTYNIPSSGVQSGYGNMFVGNTSGESITIYETNDDGSLTNFYLSKGQFVSVKGNANIGNNKCYLQLPTEMVAAAASTRGAEANYIFEEPEVISMPIVIKGLTDADGTTGIDEIIKYERQSDDAFYNLQGQRVDNPGKGLYIRNGKKIFIR